MDGTRATPLSAGNTLPHPGSRYVVADKKGRRETLQAADLYRKQPPILKECASLPFLFLFLFLFL